MRLKLQASLALWQRRVTYRSNRLARVRADAHRAGPGPGHVDDPEAAHIHKWERLLAEAQAAVKHRKAQLTAQQPLRLKALAEAQRCIGIMEVGGNNMGKAVLAFIRENGGNGPESWCSDFVAHCYRHAGSKVVQRAWAAVRYLGFLTGMKVIGYAEAQPGDIVCFTFDHTGLLERKNGDGTITTIEGNTGRTGAVSDSRTGGDGVYRKVRSTNLVARYVRVSR